MNTPETVARILLEYGAATRGDWSEIDGRTVKREMEEFATALRGGDGADWDLDRWRSRIGLCPAGKGHWEQYCPDYECEGVE